jgi:hypothetical protein
LIQSSSSPLEGTLPGHGKWARTGNNEFTFTIEKFLSGNPLTGQPGIFIFKVKEKIKLDGDTYTGLGYGEICNAAGEQCISLGCATILGNRLKVEAPPCQ